MPSPSVEPSAAPPLPPILPARESRWRVWLSRLRLANVYLSVVYLLLLHTNWGIQEQTFLVFSSSLVTGAKITNYAPLYPLSVIFALEVIAYVVWPRRIIQGVLAFFALLPALAFFGITYSATNLEFLNFSSGPLKQFTYGYYTSVAVAACITATCLFELIVVWGARPPQISLGAAPPRRAVLPASSQKKELVLMIHGTGSALPDDRGGAWWQVGSDMWQTLNGVRPDLVAGPAEAEVFHWSGSNQESDRRDAGLLLFKIMRRLEQQGRPYHLLGHSHGGSVIWHALRCAARRRSDLPNLRSWTTLGTPFLSYGADIRSLPLVLPLLVAIALAALGGGVWRDFLDVGIAGHVTSARSWILLSLTAFILLFTAGGGLLRLLTISLAATRGRAEIALDRVIVRKFAGRWRCLWSRSDEAINGLCGTLNIDWRMFHRPGRPTPTAALARLWRLLSLPFIYPIVSSATDAALWYRLRRKLQGNDLLGAALMHVGPAPLGVPVPPPLPPPLELEVVGWADEHASKSMRAMRASLGILAATSVDLVRISKGIAQRLNGRELVHFSYYQVASLKQLIVDHITATPDPGQPPPNAAKPDEKPPAADRPRQSWPVWSLALVSCSLVGLAAIALMEVYRSDIEPFTNRTQAMNRIWEGPELACDDEATLEWADVFIAGGLLEEPHAVEMLPPVAKLAIVHRLMNARRQDDAVRVLLTISHPFYRAIAHLCVAAVAPQRVRAEDWAPAQQTYGMFSTQPTALAADFDNVAPALANPQVLDRLVHSSLCIREINMTGQPWNLFGKSMTDELHEFALALARAWAGNDAAVEQLAQGMPIGPYVLARPAPAHLLELKLRSRKQPLPPDEFTKLLIDSAHAAEPQDVILLARLASRDIKIRQSMKEYSYIRESSLYRYELLRIALASRVTGDRLTTAPDTMRASDSQDPESSYADQVAAVEGFEQVITALKAGAPVRHGWPNGFRSTISHLNPDYSDVIGPMLIRELAETNGSPSLIRKYLAEDDPPISSEGGRLEQALALAAIGDYEKAWDKALSCQIPSHRLRVRTAILRNYLENSAGASSTRVPPLRDLFRKMDAITGLQREGPSFGSEWH